MRAELFEGVEQTPEQIGASRWSWESETSRRAEKGTKEGWIKRSMDGSEEGRREEKKEVWMHGEGRKVIAYNMEGNALPKVCAG